MQDLLKDIIGHTHALGFLNTIKITGDDKRTKIDSMSDDRKVVLIGETAAPHPDMVGVFGMPQLNKLKYHLDCPEYKEDAKIEVIKVTKNGDVIPVGLHFENKVGDFQNDYRFMNTEVINEKLKAFKYNTPKWDVEISPTLQSIQRFMFQASANSEHDTFVVKTENHNLKFMFGDTSSNSGEFVFAANVSGKLTKGWAWPVSNVLSILKIADTNNCIMSFSNEGALQITLDSGMAIYKYIVPAKS